MPDAFTVAVYDHEEKKPVFLQGAASQDAVEAVEAEAAERYPDMDRYEHIVLMGMGPEGIGLVIPAFYGFATTP